MNDTACHLPAETAEVEVRTQDILNREAEILHIAIPVYRYRLQELKQRYTFVPRRTFTLLHHIIALESRQRDARYVFYAQLAGQRQVFILYSNEDILREIHKVHLVDSQDNMFYSKQRNEKSVPACLGDDTCSGIHQNNSQVSRTATGNHITGILLVPRCVSNDELTLVGGEITVSYIYCYTLLALSLQAIEQQGIVYLSCTGISYAP